MHAVFRVDEIFTTILNFIYEDCSLTTLTSLARTCKTFQDPSLDILWQNQSSLFPILRCLSGAVGQRSVLDGRVVEHTHTLPPRDVKSLQHSLVCDVNYTLVNPYSRRCSTWLESRALRNGKLSALTPLVSNG